MPAHGHVGQQFLLQSGRAAEPEGSVAVVQRTAALLDQLRRDLVQALDRHARGGKQLDQQIDPVLAQAARRAEKL